MDSEQERCIASVGNSAEGAPDSPGFIKALLQNRRIHLALILLLGLAAYANTFHAPFQFDDYKFIAHNPVVMNLDNFFSNTTGYRYQPRRVVGYATFALNYRLGGSSVAGYHAANLFIHIVNAMLVYALVLLAYRSLDARRPASAGNSRSWFSRETIALFSALLFVVHPLQTQAVTYIYQRLTSLAALFYLLSITAYIRARLASFPNADQAPTSRPKAAALYLLSLLSAVLAMKTKEIAFTLPIMIVLCEVVFFPGGLKKKLLFVLPILLTLVIIPVSILGIHKPLGELLSDIGQATRLQTAMPRWDYFVTEMRVIVTYLRLLVLPVNQNLDYDYPVYHSLLDPPVAASCLFLALLAAAGVYLLWKAGRPVAGEDDAESWRPLTAFGIFWFFIALSVESSFIPIVDVIFEHRVYLPSVGAFIAFTATAAHAAGRFRSRWPASEAATAAVLCVLVLVLAGASLARNFIWQDQVRLSQDVARKSPGRARSHVNLGAAYMNRNLPDQAMNEFRAAIVIDPNNAKVHNDMGIIYYRKDMIDAAIAEYRTAIRLKPSFDEAYSNLGAAYWKRGMIPQTIEEYRKALALNPANYTAHSNLGSLYGSLRRLDEAVKEFQAAIALNPGYWEAHYNLALAYRAKGLEKMAAEEFRLAEQLRARMP